MFATKKTAKNGTSPLAMKPKDLMLETYSALTVNKARSSLTILGIVIGIASVIGLVSIGQGAQDSIQSSIESIGSNLLIVQPGAQRGFGFQVSTGRGSAETLSEDDADAIAVQVSNITNVSPEISRRYQVVYSGQNTNTSVIGATEAYPSVHNVQIGDGSFFDQSALSSYSKVAVLGPTTRDDLFGEGADPVGQKIKINNIIFTVIGVAQAKGGSGLSNADDTIYIPITTAERYLSGDKYLSSISVQAADQNVMTIVQADITAVLLDRHHIADEANADFSVINQSDIIAAASSVTGTFTILLAAIAGISLLVGGIGIMNMMLTSVTERTREIGLRKAIGAKASDISAQFLAESVMLTVAGGLIGVALGWIIALLAAHFFSLQTAVTLYSVVLAFGVAALIGIVFGYYPARRAAKLNPIEALRYE